MERKVIQRIPFLQHYYQHFFVSYLDSPKIILKKKKKQLLDRFLLTYNYIFTAYWGEYWKILLDCGEQNEVRSQTPKINFRLRTQNDFHGTAFSGQLNESLIHSAAFEILYDIKERGVKKSHAVFVNENNDFLQDVPLVGKMSLFREYGNTTKRFADLFEQASEVNSIENFPPLQQELQNLISEYNLFLLTVGEVFIFRKKVLQNCFLLRNFPSPQYFSILALLIFDAQVSDLLTEILYTHNELMRVNQFLQEKKIQTELHEKTATQIEHNCKTLMTQAEKDFRRLRKHYNKNLSPENEN